LVDPNQTARPLIDLTYWCDFVLQREAGGCLTVWLGAVQSRRQRWDAVE